MRQLSTRTIVRTGLALSIGSSALLAQTRDFPAEARTRTDDAGHTALAWVDATRQAPDQTGMPIPSQADWQPLGPFGGDMDDVSASPTAAGVVLAAYAPVSSGGGLFRSTDSGASWTEVAQLTGLKVHDIEFAPDGTVYIGTMDGVWRSTDDGQSWTALPLGIGANDQTFEVTIDPSNPQILWAGIADALGNQSVNLMQSTNGGASWVDRTPPLGTPMGGTGLTHDPNNTQKVYACFAGGFGGGSVWVSTNGGATWTDRTAGLPANPMNDIVHTGSELLVGGGMAFGSQFVGVWRSTNDGASWSGSATGIIVNDLEVDPANPARIWAASSNSGSTGALLSVDGGVSFTQGMGGTGVLALNEVSIDPLNGNSIYLAASSNAVWKSTDGGANFGPSSFGIGALNVYSVAVQDTGSPRMAVAFQGLNDGGVYTSDDGQIWTLEVLPATRYNTVMFAPSTELYAISDGPTTIAQEGLYRRELIGVWTSSLGPDQGTVFESELFGLRFSQNDPNLILIGGNDFGVAGFECAIWRSTDKGATWSRRYEGVEPFESIKDFEVVEDGTDSVWMGCFTDTEGVQDGGLMRSTDGGTTWAQVTNGLWAEAQGESLCASPSDPNTFFFADNDFPASNGGLYKSTDGGATWSNTGWMQRLQRVVCDPNDASLLYAARFDSPKLLVSTDGGASFGAYDTGADDAGTIRDLFAPPSGAALYAGTSTGAWSTILIDGVGTNFCVANANSTGQPAIIAATGSASVAANDLLLAAGPVPSQPGLFYYGPNQVQLAFGNGFRCVGGTVGRLSVTSPTGGVLQHALDVTNPPSGATQITAGSTWNFQAWFRDPAAGGAFFDLSDGLEVTFQP